VSTTRIHGFACIALTIAALLTASTAYADAVTDGQQRAAEAIKAEEAGDHAKAADLFAQALALRPNHPGLTLRLARASARAGREEGAMRALEDYAAMGLKTDADHPDFTALSTNPRMAAVREKLAQNALAIGDVTVAATLDEPRLLAEGIAVDPETNRTFIGDVHNRRILAIDSAGNKSTLVASGVHGLLGAFGMSWSGSRLWIASSGTLQTADLKTGEKGRAAIFAVDAEGRLLKRAILQAPKEEFNLGDLTVARTGDVYASDSMSGRIYRLAPGASTLHLLIASDEFHSPQGLALSGDETMMAIADYSNGIHIVSRDGKTHSILPMPTQTTLHGIDALARHGRDLVAVQNGIDPQRVILIRMAPGWTAVEGMDVLAANLPDMSEPTLASVTGEDLVFIGNGQWSRFSDDGALKDQSPFAPTKILRLKLPPPRT
jgi:tetratricopeptide (TPR) repeat protein